LFNEKTSKIHESRGVFKGPRSVKEGRLNFVDFESIVVFSQRFMV
jgi:hypothetical protein